MSRITGTSFSALAQSDSEASSMASARDATDATATASTVGPACNSSAGAPGTADGDKGFLPSFYHNEKGLRCVGAAAASGSASSQPTVKDQRTEESAQTTPQTQRGEVELGDSKRVSRKAERRSARKRAKQEKASAEKKSEARINIGDEKLKSTAREPDTNEVEALRNDTEKSPHVSGARRRRTRELERQETRHHRRDLEQAETEELEESMGGVLDARFRRDVLKCPEGIAPVSGCKHVWEISRGFVPGMLAPARFFADEKLATLCLDEIRNAGGHFLPAVRQLANVACLPGLMGYSLGMPDIHSGYGFAVGSVAAVDLTLPEAVVSPGGVGFDINCGVRLLRTSLFERDVKGKVCAELATALFKAVPSGVGSSGAYTPKDEKELKAALKSGMKWALDRGLCWPEDLERTEERGMMSEADPDAVSSRAIKRGLPQLGTLGSGNHYLELQVVDEIFDKDAAAAMGLEAGRICVMIHCGSRGLGHQLCTDYLQRMESTMGKQGIRVPDRQLCCVRALSPEGETYLSGMAAAANYAFVNRTLIAHAVRETFQRELGRSARDDLKMHMVYDVAHNIAKKEQHLDPADNKLKLALVHRKGATRSFPPGHAALPHVYRDVGQPVLIGGSMGTCSYVLVGTVAAMKLSFGSTCHGAGRRMSRSQALRTVTSHAVLASLRSRQIEVRVATPKLAAEEADESYKDVTSVVQTCHEVGISRKVAKLRPIAVIKG
eukprot:TRINITY_DN74608_c0_g1_i1.p1 TRINITY_DN74608_c0_g1~~TRINITY_DN74608_c0_g1_i1.p1  ORF type:complete len:724 (+),score=123.37 TRINITY_DN74608_c0_g1_i1:100-2271(+)